MSAKPEQRSYDEAVAWLRDHGFDILDAPGAKARVFVKKFGCSAAIEKADDDTTKVFAKPGYLISGEISRLVEENFDMRPAAFRRELDLHRPIFQKTAAYGHFGREDHDFTWERTDRADSLRQAAGLEARATA